MRRADGSDSLQAASPGDTRLDEIAFDPLGRYTLLRTEGAGPVYMRPFPNVDSARFAISVAGGMEPMWRRDGTELFFRNARGEMSAVPVSTGRRFEHGTPKLLFSVPGRALQGYHRSYDVHPDGKRFLMVPSGGAEAPDLNVIFNWRTELQGIKEASR